MSNHKKKEIMTKQEKDFIYRVFTYCFCWTDDVQKLFDSMIDDVYEDIMETADHDNWHSGDVQIAIRRVLFERLGID